MNMAPVFIQIARHLYQVMTPKVTISTKEEDTYYMGFRGTGELKSVHWVTSYVWIVVPAMQTEYRVFVKARYYGGKIRLRKS